MQRIKKTFGKGQTEVFTFTIQEKTLENYVGNVNKKKVYVVFLQQKIITISQTDKLIAKKNRVFGSI